LKHIKNGNEENVEMMQRKMGKAVHNPKQENVSVYRVSRMEVQNESIVWGCRMRMQIQYRISRLPYN